jgi:hypothetical protein
MATPPASPILDTSRYDLSLLESRDQNALAGILRELRGEGRATHRGFDNRGGHVRGFDNRGGHALKRG